MASRTSSASSRSGSRRTPAPASIWPADGSHHTPEPSTSAANRPHGARRLAVALTTHVVADAQQDAHEPRVHCAAAAETRHGAPRFDRRLLQRVGRIVHVAEHRHRSAPQRLLAVLEQRGERLAVAVSRSLYQIVHAGAPFKVGYLLDAPRREKVTPGSRKFARCPRPCEEDRQRRMRCRPKASEYCPKPRLWGDNASAEPKDRTSTAQAATAGACARSCRGAWRRRAPWWPGRPRRLPRTRPRSAGHAPAAMSVTCGLMARSSRTSGSSSSTGTLSTWMPSTPSGAPARGHARHQPPQTASSQRSGP